MLFSNPEYPILRAVTHGATSLWLGAKTEDRTGARPEQRPVLGLVLDRRTAGTLHTPCHIANKLLHKWYVSVVTSRHGGIGGDRVG
jgi:hypothetical protein